MKKVLIDFKDTYEQVDENTFHRINPYARMRAIIKNKYPFATIIKTETFTDFYGESHLQVPVFAVTFSVPEVS